MREPVPELKPRYDELSDASGLFTDPAAVALRSNPLQQLWREHLLAQSMIGNGLYDEGYLVMIAPALNYHVQDARRGLSSALARAGGRQGPVRQSHPGRRHRNHPAQRPGPRRSPSSPLLRLLAGRWRAGIERGAVRPSGQAPGPQIGGAVKAYCESFTRDIQAACLAGQAEAARSRLISFRTATSFECLISETTASASEIAGGGRHPQSRIGEQKPRPDFVRFLP